MIKVVGSDGFTMIFPNMEDAAAAMSKFTDPTIYVEDNDQWVLAVDKLDAAIGDTDPKESDGIPVESVKEYSRGRRKK